MKTLLFSSLLLLTACDRDIILNPSDVPAPVMSAFQEKYSGATDVRWEKEGDNYEAEFKVGGKKKEAEFSADGKLVKEE